MTFCEKCGARIEGDSAFCTKCGAPAKTAAAPPAANVVAPAPPQAQAQPVVPPPRAAVAPPSPAPSPPSSTSSGNVFIKIVVGVLGFIALVSVLAIGSCFYIGYRAKKKVEEIQQAYKQSEAGKIAGSTSDRGQSGGTPDLGGILGALGKSSQGSSSSTVETRQASDCPSGDRAGFDDFIKAGASASIPFEPGLTLTSVWQPEKNGHDIETIISINDIQTNKIHMTGNILNGNSVPGDRYLCIADFLNGHEYESEWGETTTGGIPKTMPGTTMFSLSRAQFADLKAGRQAEMTWYQARERSGGAYELSGILKGALSHIEPNDVPYSIIVNGTAKNLPTIHARETLSTLSGSKHFNVEAWVLDDEANPLVLNFIDTTGKWHITYVKITFPAKTVVEQQLAQTGRAEIYGIYFDFNSATPRPESAPVLKEIAQALNDNPGWKLEIDGHTDSIGGDAYNLKLSQHRAEGIMQTLVAQYGIAGDRLTAKGYGASRPKATNDTVEGRALNRRVELVRE